MVLALVDYKQVGERAKCETQGFVAKLLADTADCP
jgi:hypothetical protein